jgi:sugar phosphate isomerase/epimerase
MKPMPPDEELMQLPGRGKLNFRPLLQALKNIRFTGWTEIFMHHTAPRYSHLAYGSADNNRYHSVAAILGKT